MSRYYNEVNSAFAEICLGEDFEKHAMEIANIVTAKRGGFSPMQGTPWEALSSGTRELMECGIPSDEAFIFTFHTIGLQLIAKGAKVEDFAEARMLEGVLKDYGDEIDDVIKNTPKMTVWGHVEAIRDLLLARDMGKPLALYAAITAGWISMDMAAQAFEEASGKQAVRFKDGPSSPPPSAMRH